MCRLGGEAAPWRSSRHDFPDAFGRDMFHNRLYSRTRNMAGEMCRPGRCVRRQGDLRRLGGRVHVVAVAGYPNLRRNRKACTGKREHQRPHAAVHWLLPKNADHNVVCAGRLRPVLRRAIVHGFTLAFTTHITLNVGLVVSLGFNRILPRLVNVEKWAENCKRQHPEQTRERRFGQSETHRLKATGDTANLPAWPPRDLQRVRE